MREAAADLNFEEAARLRDEVKRLRATELAVVDDPTVKQRVVQGKAGAYAGRKQFGDAANLPARLDQLAAQGKRGGKFGSRARKPTLDEMGPGTESRIYQPKSMTESMPNALPRGGASPSPRSSRGESLPPTGSGGRGEGQATSPGSSSRIHKPDLDEMGIATWHEVKPVQGKRPRKPAAGDTGSSGSKIFQPTNSRESGPEFGPSPRSTGGAPGHRGGWKKR
jgi:excinuclease ABC subunit B